MKKIALSVLIPTYNRYQYLKDCLLTTLSIDSDEFEVIVQDNTEDNGEILPFIRKLDDKRLKYFHIKEHISVSDNSDQAMSHACGKYICMIGDDDTICENLIETAKFCEANDIDAINYLIPGFNWPDMTFEKRKKEANMFFRYKADGTVIIIDEKKELDRAIKSADGLLETMPRAYHGLVSKACMDKIYEKTSSYFPGPSPDMGNAAAVCLVANKTAFIRDYVIVSGYGYNSARGEGNRQKHYGKLEEKPWLPKDILKRWDKSIPPIFSAETITADSLIESLTRMGREDLVKGYNYPALYAIFFGHHKDALLQMGAFCLKNPVRGIHLIKGIRIRNKLRRAYKKNPPDQSYFREEMNVRKLQDAQDKVRLLRKELGITSLKMSK